jgi:hypothetical protein
MFPEGFQLALKDIGLPLQAFQLALAGMILRRDRGLKVLRTRLGPWRMCGFRSGGYLDFKPLQAPVKKFKAALYTSGLLPWTFAIKSGESGDGLGESAQISYKCSDELGERTTARPGFRQQSLQGFFRVVVGQASGAAGVGQQTR